jgi:hypothetical protein
MKAKPLSRIFSGLASIFSFSPFSASLFVCILVMLLVYRIQLTIALFNNPIKPFDFDPAAHGLWFWVRYFPYDVLLLFSFFILSCGISPLHLVVRSGAPRSILKASGFILLHLFLLLLALLHGAHTRLLFDAQTGFSYSVLVELLLNVPLAQLATFIDLKDILLLLFPLGLFWGMMLCPFAFRTWIVRASIGSIILLLFFSVLKTSSHGHRIPADIRLNPALFLLSDMAGNGLFKSDGKDRYVKIDMENETTLQPIGSEFRNQMKPIKILPPKNDHLWNIIFFVMESVGTRYMFDTEHGNPMPMPFLHTLSKESWHLKKHFTSSNISTKANFSLLSGLYDFFHQETFGIRADARVPSIHNYLGGHYDRFLVTPSPIQWYFPTAFMNNSGLTEMHHFANLNLGKREELHSLGRYIGRDEVQTVDYFIQRVSKAKEPFLGIYLSFAAHLPYFDYGPDYRIRNEDGRLITRYYNNLNLLDQMLRRIHGHLRKGGLLERTIFVIVGDHGQAFGQHHSDNYMHHRYSYNENLETPAIIYQPTLFRPRVFDVPTSHVDILPTLLDAMRIPYPPAYLDGESLFHHPLRRKYIFFYGHEGTISSLDTQFVKTQSSLKNQKCWVFDLKKDPLEKHPLDCSSYESQLDALRRFVGFHDAGLVRYNESVKEKKRMLEAEGPPEITRALARGR